MGATRKLTDAMKQSIAFFVLLLLIGCDDMKPKSEKLKIETPEGVVELTKTNVDAVPQETTAVSGADLDTLTTQSSLAFKFFGKYIPDSSTPSLKECDSAFFAWKSDTSGDFTANDVVRVVGCYLGNRCIEDFDMEWVTVHDEYGTDYAVRGTHVEVMIFPFSSVQKRIDDKEHDFVHGVYHALRNMLESGDYKAR